MRIFPPELEIGDAEGFTPAKDIFGRKALGDGLTNLIQKVSDPVVVAVDAKWGAGKTAFLRMWAGELRQLGIPVIYFDAFKNDYAEDAFTALAGEIVGLIEAEKKKSAPAAKAFLKHAKGASKILLRSGLRLGVKVATLNTVDTKDFEESAVAVADELSGLTDQYVGELLTRQRAQRETFAAFGDALAALPAILAPPVALEPQRPLVVIIDELDRCRPDYALQVLERVKHFLSVPNVHFVLGAHVEQLQNSVVAAYGAGIDARLYLQKFIHLTIHLVDDSRYEHDRIIPKYLAYLKRSLAFEEKDEESVRYCIQNISGIAQQADLSLRSIERVMTYLALALTFTKPSFLRPPPIIAGLCVLRVTRPDLFVKAKRKTLSYSEVAAALQFDQAADLDEFQVRWWRFCTDPEMPIEQVSELANALNRYSMSGDRMDILPVLANGVVDRLSPD